METIKRCFISIMFLGLIGCGPENPNPVHIPAIIDITEKEARLFDPNKLRDGVFFLSGLDTNQVSQHSVCYSIIILSELTTNPGTGDCLEKDDDFLNRSTGKRLKEINDFGLGIINDYEALIHRSPLAGRDSSQVYRSIQQQLVNLNNKTGEKYLLVYSDLLHNIGALDFYNIKKDSIVLTEDFIDSTYNELQQYYPLPNDLSEITIIIIYQPTPKTDEAFEIAKRWWRWVIQSRNGRIEFFSDTNSLLLSSISKSNVI